MGEIKAIETSYRGYRFRSRLEARWAIVLDALGIGWQYEPEGFETSAGRYLPDFRIESGCVRHWPGDHWKSDPTAGEVYLEIKGADLRDDEAARLHAFATDPGDPRWVLMLGDVPEPGSWPLFVEGIGQAAAMSWCIEPGRVEAFAGPYSAPLTPDRMSMYAGHFRRKPPHGGGPGEVARALVRGRSARFEHGENGSARMLP